MATRDQGPDKARGFLSRWSQRKQAAEQEADDPARKPGQPAPHVAGETAVGTPPAKDRDPRQADDPAQTLAAVDPAGNEVADFDLKDLPDIDSLGAGSDFTVFLRAGVPDALRRRALRKLWRVHPVLGIIDGLDDYNLDYTDAAMVVPNMKTLYQVGKGMILPEDEVAEEAAEAAAQELAAVEEGGRQGETAMLDQDRPAGAEETQPDSVETSEALAPAQAQTAAPPPRKRNPGDPVVSPSAASGKVNRHSAEPRPAARSARSRRWGDSDG